MSAPGARRRSRRPLILIGALALLTGLAFLVARPSVPDPTTNPYAGKRGGSLDKSAGLLIRYRRGDEVRSVEPQTVLRAGDVLDFKVRGEESSYLEVRRRDPGDLSDRRRSHRRQGLSRRFTAGGAGGHRRRRQAGSDRAVFGDTALGRRSAGSRHAGDHGGGGQRIAARRPALGPLQDLRDEAGAQIEAVLADAGGAAGGVVGVAQVGGVAAFGAHL